MNLPDDWGSYYRICEDCGKRYHLSGADLCDCEPCAQCGEVKPPDEFTLDEDGELCDTCIKEREDPRDEWDRADELYAEWKDNPEDRGDR